MREWYRSRHHVRDQDVDRDDGSRGGERRGRELTWTR